jgi:hypothetical protein
VGTLLQLVRWFVGDATTDAPALTAALPMLALGLLYPYAGTAVRTRAFFTQPIEGTWMADPAGERTPDFYTQRSLDSLAWLGQTKAYRDDLPAIEWLIEHGANGAIVLEAPGILKGSYTPEGRVSSATGLPTLVGWVHHENQWRGWEQPMPLDLQRRLFDEFAELLPAVEDVTLPREKQIELYRTSLASRDALIERLRDVGPRRGSGTPGRQADTIIAARNAAFTAVALTRKLNQRMDDLLRAPAIDDEVTRLLRLYDVRYIFTGRLERQTYAAGADKFAAFPRVFAHGTTAIYEVPRER